MSGKQKYPVETPQEWLRYAEGDSPAVLVTAYRPDPERWSDDFLGRKL